MEKEISKKPSSRNGKTNGYLFRGIMYLLYGKRAGETEGEKSARLGVIIIVLVALVVIFSAIKRVLFT